MKASRPHLTALLACAAAASAGAMGTGDADTAWRAVASLEQELEAPSLSLASWNQAARDAAESLGRERAFDVLGIAGDERATPHERVAAAELFRRLSGDATALGSLELAWLRSTAFGGVPDAALASAARFALAGLGDWGDRLRLVRELETGQNPEARRVAAWCLQVSGTEAELRDLARLLRPGAGACAPELAAAALEAIVRDRVDRAELTAALGDELVDHLLAALDAPFCPLELEQHACGALAALGGPRALGRLERMAREGAEHAARALEANPDGRLKLARIVGDPWAGDRGQIAAAAALAEGHPGAQADPLVEAGLAVLGRIARTGLEVDLRRRAVLALGASAGAVRAGREQLLAACVEGDADPEVRALASRLLEQAGRAAPK